MESPLPAVFHDYAKRTQQGDLLVSYWLGYTMIRLGSNKKIKLKFWNTLKEPTLSVLDITVMSVVGSVRPEMLFAPTNTVNIKFQITEMN